VRVGLNLPQYAVDFEGGGCRPDRVIWLARRAEQLGLDSVWLSDHPFVVAPDGTICGALEPLTLATSLLRRLRSASVGTLVLAATMRSPDVMTSMAKTLGSPRFVLGVGTGWYEPEHRAYGVTLDPFPRRVMRLREVAECAVSLPRPRPRVLVGGSSPHVLDVCARWGDLWNCAWDPSPSTFAALNERLDEACLRANRDPTAVSRSLGVTVAVAHSKGELDRAGSRLRARAPYLKDVTTEALRDRILVGTPEQCVERLAAYGADEVVVTLLLRDDEGMLEVLGTDVAPGLHAL
jgi:alkanesulfonate monooxygenase SsuD/methylene tetrahydromethanopterin reductase-like flavin-dependent oxidoreductase (luciferase family)